MHNPHHPYAFVLVALVGCEGLNTREPVRVSVEVVPEQVPSELTSAWLTVGMVDFEPCPHSQWSPIDLVLPSAHAHGGGPPPPTGTDVDRSAALSSGETVLLDTFSPTRDLYCGLSVELRPASTSGEGATTAGWSDGEHTVQTDFPVYRDITVEHLVGDDAPFSAVIITVDLSDWPTTASADDPGMALYETLLGSTQVRVEPRSAPPEL